MPLPFGSKTAFVFPGLYRKAGIEGWLSYAQPGLWSSLIISQVKSPAQRAQGAAI